MSEPSKYDDPRYDASTDKESTFYVQTPTERRAAEENDRNGGTMTQRHADDYCLSRQ